MNNLNEKDLYCITKILQSSIFENNLFFGCKYCKYKKKCSKSFERNHALHFDVVRRKLQNITKLDMGYMYNPKCPETKFKEFTT